MVTVIHIGGRGIMGVLTQEEMMEQELTLSIDGMHCGACVQRVTNALLAVNGVDLGAVEVGSATLSFDPEETTSEEIAQVIDRIGFRVTAQR
jgi:copper chaperone